MPKENCPKFRVIGRASEDVKARVEQETRNLLIQQNLDDLPNEWKEIIQQSELPKTAEELSLINLANQKTSKLMMNAGLAAFDVPPNNFRLLPASAYEKMAQEKGSAGATVLMFQMITLNAGEARKSLLVFGCAVFHEMMHLKSHLTLQIESEHEGALVKTSYREGLMVKPSQNIIAQNKYHEHFRGLNDALVASQEKKFFQDLLKLSFIQEKQKDFLDAETIKIKEQASRESGVPEDEIVWMSRDGKDGVTISYQPHREVLDFVVDEIQKELPDQYSSKEQVLTEFLKAFFTGQISSLARLVEKTFGPGSFEVLGMMGDDDQTPIQVLEYLKRARAHQINADKR